MESIQVSSSGAIVGSEYCVPHSIDLAFTSKIAGVRHGNLAVTDVNGKLLFWLDGSALSFKDRRSLVDGASGRPLISMREKFRSLHGRWHVFRGDSTNKKDLLFSVKRSSAFQFRTELEVFLATNTREEVCDFKIKGEYYKKSCVIYKGDTSVVLAQMGKEHKVANVRLGKSAFGVNVGPNTDFAFVTALVIILHEIYQEILAAAEAGASAGAAVA